MGFKLKIQQYERTCGEVCPIVEDCSCPGIEDDDLRRHLLMHAARLSTYPLVREEF